MCASERAIYRTRRSEGSEAGRRSAAQHRWLQPCTLLVWYGMQCMRGSWHGWIKAIQKRKNVSYSWGRREYRSRWDLRVVVRLGLVGSVSWKLWGLAEEPSFLGAHSFTSWRPIMGRVCIGPAPNIIHRPGARFVCQARLAQN